MKKTKLILNFGITSLVLAIIFVLLLGVWILISFMYYDISMPNYYYAMLVASEIIVILGLVVSSIFSITGSILILATDFKNNEVNNSRMLWGLLSLLLIGPIGIIIFTKNIAGKLVNESADEKISTTISSSINKTNDQLEDITKAFKLFEAGAITQEEFDKIKEKNL